MLWLALHIPDLPLALRQPVDEGAVVVCERRGQRRHIVLANAAARAAHIDAGMEVSAALVRQPGLRVLERQRTPERAALKALCGWAEQFSSRLCMDAERWLVWMEVGASLRYFAGLDALCTQVQTRIAALGYQARIGVAPTLEAAALLAIQPDWSTPGSTRGATRVVMERAALSTVLGTLPIESVPLNDAGVMQTLKELGWHTLAAVWSLPSADLARRAGPAWVDYLRRLRGETVDVRVMWRAPATYQRRFDLAAPVVASEPLWFPLRRLLLELQGHLRGRDTALQTLHLDLLHERAPLTTLTLRTTAPQRDAGLLFNLLREQLEQWPWTQPVCGIQLRVAQWVSPGNLQQDLFADPRRQDRGWAELMDRLQARLGAQAVRRLGLLDDHRPERAWCVLDDPQANNASALSSSTSTSISTSATHQLASPPAPRYHLPEDHPARPLWLLTPRPLDSLPALLGKPERIECGWWSERDERRDYYLARTTEGSRWWLYRDADTAQWFLHGLWA